jgi:hypothetical protein
MAAISPTSETVTNVADNRKEMRDKSVKYE